jgi:ADP-heptose:LPS heptosyltransferase
MKKLILRNQLAPGDIVMLTAAVRDLHRCYPGQFITDVRTSCASLWENNPYLTPLSEDDSQVEIIECSYPLINSSNSLPYHCLHGFIAFLNERLGLAIKPTAFRGDIHLSPQEKAWYSQVHELAGSDLPFWIIAAGGKYDITIKWWSSKRYQEVVDHFRGRIQFVQVGAPGHYHPKLDRVIDLRGKTNLREFIRLIYHSQGVVCGVTAAMHLAAAIETKPGFSRSRPCVVVAGGREPAHWEAYPDHQFISTNGALPCCVRGGCWRSRTFPLGDGDDRDGADHLCVDVVNDLPRCMDTIGADEVCRRIELYLQGGVIQPLSAPQRKDARKAVRLSRRNRYDESTLTPHNTRLALEKFLKNIPPPPCEFEGRGIVICGGGVRYFTNAWVCINILRQLGCALPIELWHLGAHELDATMRALVEPLGVTCVDAFEVAKSHPVRRLGGWQSKPYAILHSRFREVLFLDADNVPVVNPEFLFDTPHYQKTGAIFWPDFPSASEEPGVVWKCCGLERPGTAEFESGQIVVDKARCWESMRLALWFNEHSDFFYQYIHGDKETFHLAFHKLKCSYGYVPTPIHRLPGTMCQHDFEGRRIFQHRNMDKWNLFLQNRRIPDFQFEEHCFNYVRALRERWDGNIGRYLNQPNFKSRRPLKTLRIEACVISCKPREGLLRQTLASLRASDWGDRPVHIEIDASLDVSPNIRQTDTALAALQASLRTPATHILFLEDDVIFNQHLLHNLVNWAPLANGVAIFASLYNPGIRALASNFRENYSLCPSEACFGSQAFIIARDALKFVLAHWGEIDGMQDIRISRLAARLQSPMFYHAPSLVQHVGLESTHGADFHEARDFDLGWKAPSL